MFLMRKRSQVPGVFETLFYITRQFPADQFKVSYLDCGFITFRIRDLCGNLYTGFIFVCKQKNHSGTKTFSIRHKFGSFCCVLTYLKVMHQQC